uniref:Uncharacterized protein n=1 Tax=Cajanus cajan TaxID=3821 RepID=A0A151SMI5_CAJCA|nr:hypothetical protein KK1_002268 [Cajanus cajan]
MHDDDDDDDEDEDDEDDCIILEGDPEKGASVVEEATDSDELLVIGEKGPIACRDYPHARHLCATFPFSSTPHERHCSQCHCYVCDSIAPCLKWGTGSLGSDHSSTNFVSRSTALHTISSLNSIPHIQTSLSTITRPLSTSSPNSSVQNQISRPINTTTMSTGTNITVPNGANLGSLSCVNQHTVASETQANTQPLPQPNDSQDFHQTCIQVNDGTLSSYAPCLNENEPQIRSQDGNADGNTAQFGTASQDTSQPQPHVEPPMETVGSFSAFDSCWNDNTGQSILQSSGSANGAPPAGSHAPLIEYPQLSNSLVDFESWLFERNSFPAVTNEFLSSDPLSPDPIIPSPNLDSDDMGNVLHYLDGD